MFILLEYMLPAFFTVVFAMLGRNISQCFYNGLHSLQQTKAIRLDMKVYTLQHCRFYLPPRICSPFPLTPNMPVAASPRECSKQSMLSGIPPPPPSMLTEMWQTCLVPFRPPLPQAAPVTLTHINPHRAAQIQTQSPPTAPKPLSIPVANIVPLALPSV